MSNSTPDISGVISKLMQNDEFSNMVKELRGDGGTTDIMDKLPGIMAMLSPMIEADLKDEKTADGSTAVQGKAAGRESRYDKARAARLMSALKPYLSPERCGMIDKCMSVMQIGDVMTVLRGLDAAGGGE